MIDIPFAVQTAKGSSPLNTSETLINLYAEKNLSTSVSDIVIKNTPGYTVMHTFDTNPILGLHAVENKIYIATEYKLYVFDTVTHSIGELGALNLTEPVTFAYNGTHLIITAGDSYVYDGTSVSKITDPNYYQADTVTYQDGYFIFNRKGTGQFFITNLYSINFDALMYATAESSPDNLLAVKSDSKKLWLFGSETIEVWYNSGDTFPFDRLQGGIINVGLLDHKTIQLVNNTLIFLGNDGIVYAINDFTPVRISNEGIEQAISTESVFNSTSYSANGHHFYLLHTDDATYVYDLTTGLWHTRKTDNKRWGITYITSDGKYGTSKEGTALCTVGEDIYTYNGTNILREVITAPITKGGEYFTINSIQLYLETGAVPYNADDNIYLQYSNNGIDWSNFKQQSLGNIGERNKRVKWNRLGRHTEAMFKIYSYAPVSFRLLKLYGSIR